MRLLLKQLCVFTYHAAMSCIFPVGIFLTLALSKLLTIPGLPRYDFILAGCILLQLFMYVSKLETKDELKVICVFHLIGIALELFKVHMGSWSYPEEGFSKLYGVPLYSGFMYASVASFICQAWRRLELSLDAYPPIGITVPFGVSIYLNFFTHHFIFDVRYLLIILLCILFYRSKVGFKLGQISYAMPLSLSFLCIGFFIWIAENMATYLDAWRYPNQDHSWHFVHPSKIVAWFLLVIVSFVIVAELKRLKTKQ
ncbi:DUF817 domain-containing protein [Paenibacillus aceris]|uniref:Uncharacterized membrane protein YoaT (DUF817 family) n=1 Tax=Paenibacillus aceris TaxID=869555 RepID=A0ABS4I0H1_9BACL|nr:DUF817 domain-containing protein [Paenibacillus aceris]MBP1964417.1 uncharacterized membrane protein YoaT (DUF817 family) [Paenibacillus aceris]NHW35869.1 DUF817 domain-containing protein [Paenibacillus aceris]